MTEPAHQIIKGHLFKPNPDTLLPILFDSLDYGTTHDFFRCAINDPEDGTRLFFRYYPLAGKLCRKVLEDMKETLPRTEQKSAFYDLGRISEITGDKETAFTCYQNALRIDPFYRDARERIGGILKRGRQTSS